jgi:hypothetical protein|tara:strand:+ start:97 stop:438 length:342 start_codon:yes stop_codon:yes gene_type:complete
MNKYIVLTIGIFLFNNILIWYQLNGQLVWDFWKTSRGIILSLLMGIPITGLFWLATKWGYVGFGNLWAVRFMGFATSMISFPIMTWLYLGETITLKTLVTILLAFIIMLLQLL